MTPDRLAASSTVRNSRLLPGSTKCCAACFFTRTTLKAIKHAFAWLPYLLAFAYGHLGQNDLLHERTDAEKYLLLACLNLLEGVAYIGAQLPSKSAACSQSRWADWRLAVKKTWLP